MDSDSTFPGPLDWRKDMIDVPTAREIRELLKNKDRRLELVEDAFSEALAHAEREMDAQPQEATSHADAIAGSSPFGNAQAPGTDEYDPSMMFPQGAATPDIKIKAEPAPDEPINQGILAPGIQSPLPAISRSPSDMPRFGEDEYDPSHPARGQDVVRFERPLRRQGSPGMEYPRPRRQVIVREPYEDIYSPPRRFYRSYEAPSPVFRSRSAYLVYPEYERPMERPPLMVRQEGGYSYSTYEDAPGMDTLGPGDGRSRNYGSATVGREISKQLQSAAAAPRTESLAPGQPPLDIPTETGHGAAPPPPLPPVSAPDENLPAAPTEQDPQPADDLYARSRSQQPRHHSQDGRQYYDDRPQTRHVYGSGRHYYRGPHYHHEPRVVRSRNTNFARYNAEHRRLARNRSQSPGGSSQPPDAARQAYRERSPEPRPSPMEQEGDYRRASYPSREYHEFVPVEEYDDYRPGPPPVRYRYADQPPPPPMYVDEYGRPLQVVSYPPAYARSPPRRYMAPHNIDEAMEYVPHDAPAPDAAPYGDREYVYYSSDRRGYEYESAPPPPPGIARRGYAGAEIR